MFLIKWAALVNLKFCYTRLSLRYDRNLGYLEKGGHLGSRVNGIYGSPYVTLKTRDDKEKS